MHQSILRVLAAAVVSAFLATGSTAASDLSYTYLIAGAVGVDVDQSAAVENPKKDLLGEVSTDSDTGFYLGASWAVSDRWLVFALYQQGGQDVSLKGTGNDGLGNNVPVNRDDDFNLTQLRAGVGYVKPMGETWDLYGRLSFDYVNMDSVGFPSKPAGKQPPLTPGVPGIPGDDEDDYGFGAQIGARMAFWKSFDGEAYVRYTSVGDLSIDSDYSGSFDDDLLGGVEVHWDIGNRFGLEAGYEYGEITTWRIGARFTL